MSINTGGFIEMKTTKAIELMYSAGEGGRCGFCTDNNAIHYRNENCNKDPECMSMGFWKTNEGVCPDNCEIGAILTRKDLLDGTVHEKENLIELDWSLDGYKKYNSTIIYYQLEEKKEEKKMEIKKEVRMGKFGKAEVSKMAHYFQSVEQTMKPFREFRVMAGERSYWHVKQGGTVCLMAHIDTVKVPTLPRHYNGTIWAKGLDDRLGVYMAMKLFSERSDVDVIITDDEEIGMSTADMLTKKDLAQYNSILELDRGGNDFVHYGCADTDLINAYSIYAEEGIGAFSDIDFITDDARGCGCINIGIGYENAHGDNSYVKIEDLATSWRDINHFLDVYHDVKFVKANKINYDYGYKYYDYSGAPTANTINDEYLSCNYCGHIFPLEEMVSMGKGAYSCEDCFDDLIAIDEKLEKSIVDEDEEKIYKLCHECTLELMEHEEKDGLCEYCKAKEKSSFQGHFQD